jgi:tripartite-type tricarboxylate transporter receptor subunit TctC
VRERFTALAVEPRVNTPAEFRALLEADLKRWAKVVKDAGIRIE